MPKFEIEMANCKVKLSFMVASQFMLSEREREQTIEEPLEMPYWNLLCQFVYVCSVTKNKITKPYARKFDGLLVNDDKIVNQTQLY